MQYLWQYNETKLMNFIKYVFGTTDVSWNYTLGRNERELFLQLLATVYLNLPISYINPEH
jgi:hypothetical protein